jgi:hypothetical protein
MMSEPNRSILSAPYTGSSQVFCLGDYQNHGVVHTVSQCQVCPYSSQIFNPVTDSASFACESNVIMFLARYTYYYHFYPCHCVLMLKLSPYHCVLMLKLTQINGMSGKIFPFIRYLSGSWS